MIDLDSLDAAGVKFSGLAAGDRLGSGTTHATIAGDINGDGIDGLLLGARGTDGDGRVYVVFGSSAGPDLAWRMPMPC